MLRCFFIPLLAALTVLTIRPVAAEISAAGDDAPQHWALKPLVAASVPEGAAHPIDAFIREKLRGRGLHPSPEADRRTLIRRIYFDLIGLPPNPEEIAEFIGDAAPDAFEHLVDRLLASPRYGERWARHWIDLAHFAETHGHGEVVHALLA